MFTIDESLRSLSATRDQIVSLYQSINSPHLAIPGRKAGPAQAFIAGLRSASGFCVYVYLYLAEVSDCAIYISSRGNVSSEAYRGEEDEALAFVESMGFMVDNMNFRALSAERQSELLQTLPLFRRELKPRESKKVSSPPAPAGPAQPEAGGSFAALIGRIFSSF